MESFKHHVVTQRFSQHVVGEIAFNIADCAFTSAEDYSIFIECGHAWVLCNDMQASPPIIKKTGTTFTIFVQSGPVVVSILANKGVGKGDV